MCLSSLAKSPIAATCVCMQWKRPGTAKERAPRDICVILNANSSERMGVCVCVCVCYLHSPVDSYLCLYACMYMLTPLNDCNCIR